jgi:hypothetical protein
VGSGGDSLYGSSVDIETVKVLWAFMERFTDALCYAAWMAKVEQKGNSQKFISENLYGISSNVPEARSKRVIGKKAATTSCGGG